MILSMKNNVKKFYDVIDDIEEARHAFIELKMKCAHIQPKIDV